MRRQDRTRIAHHDEQFCLRKSREDRGDVITIRRRFLDPTAHVFKRPAKGGGVRFHHQNQQILLGVGRIECRLFEQLIKSPGRKIGIVALAPFASASEKDIGERLPGDVIELRATAARPVFSEHGWEVGRLFRQDEQLRMIVEQGNHQGGAGLGLAGDETGALIERESLDRHLHFARLDCRNHSINRGSPSLSRVDGL